jgi:hypothetical protein
MNVRLREDDRFVILNLTTVTQVSGEPLVRPAEPVG